MLVSFSSQGPLGHHWHAVAMSADVHDEPIAVELLRDQLVLWRGPSGAVIAAPDRCTHRKADLSLGVVKDGCLECPLHGWTFGEDGRCVRIPLRDVIEEKNHLKAFRCEERHGLVWVCLGDPRTAIPIVDVGDDPASVRINAKATRWAAPAPRIVEALLDHGLSGCDFDLPFTFRRTITTGDDVDAELLVTCSPVGAATSHLFSVLWTSSDTAAAGDLLEGEIAAITAIKPAVEAVSGMFEIDQSADKADGAADWRRALRETLTAQV